MRNCGAKQKGAGSAMALWCIAWFLYGPDGGLCLRGRGLMGDVMALWSVGEIRHICRYVRLMMDTTYVCYCVFCLSHIFYVIYDLNKKT